MTDIDPKLVELMREIVAIPPDRAERLASESEILRKTIVLSRILVSENDGV